MSVTLRSFLSHEWQDSGAVSASIFKSMGVKITPARLTDTLKSAFPDVETDGILVRLTGSAGNPADSTDKRHEERRVRRQERGR